MKPKSLKKTIPLLENIEVNNPKNNLLVVHSTRIIENMTATKMKMESQKTVRRIPLIKDISI